MDLDMLTSVVRDDGSSRTLFVTGELDVSTAPVFESAAGEALDGQCDELCLNLTLVTFVDSTGARAIVHAYNTAELLGTRLVIHSPAPEVRRVLELMGLDRVTDIKDGRPARKPSA